MTENGDAKRRRGREATTAAILDSAEQLFYERGYNAVTVRDIAKRAGVSHPLVHQYAGSKAEMFRVVLSRNEEFMVSGAPDNPDLLESASLILRYGLGQRGRAHARLLVGSALRGVPYDRTAGRFEAIERLVELAERQAGSASQAERVEKDLDPRLAVACVGSLYLGWVAGESWMRPAAGLESMDDAELIDGLERVILGILRDHVPGVAHDVAPTAEIGQLKA
jgi:TetR/AcrR family transcriptional regulator, repressor for neighboring sulfatase